MNCIPCEPPCKALPEVEFSFCNPKTYPGQVTTLYLSSRRHPLMDHLDPDEWADRLLLPQNDPAKIIVLSGIGDKPLPERNEYQCAFGVIQYSNKLHRVNFTMRQLGDINYNMMVEFERTRKALGWFKTTGGKTSGGKGIPLTIMFDQVIPESFADLENLTGSIFWDSELHPCRNDSVI